MEASEAAIWTVHLDPTILRVIIHFVNNMIHSRMWLDRTRENRVGFKPPWSCFIDGKPPKQVEQYYYMEETPELIGRVQWYDRTFSSI